MVFIFLAYFTLYNGLQFHPSQVNNLCVDFMEGEICLVEMGRLFGKQEDDENIGGSYNVSADGELKLAFL